MPELARELEALRAEHMFKTYKHGIDFANWGAAGSREGGGGEAVRLVRVSEDHIGSGCPGRAKEP
jgi:hypothetical protein